MNPKITLADVSSFLNCTPQYIHKMIKEKGFTTKKSSQRLYWGHETSRLLLKLKFPEKKVIAIQIVKGGPGKTSITKNLGIRSALYGARVLLIDLDQQANLTQDLTKNANDRPVMIDLIDEKDPADIEDSIVSIFPGLDLLPSRLDNSALDNLITLERLPVDRVIKDQIDKVKDRYDLILIDCAPALSASVAAATLACDLVISPVAPEKYCLDGLTMSYNELRNIAKRYKRNIEQRLILNKFDSRTLASSEIMSMLHSSPIFKPLLYKTVIRLNQEVSNSTLKQESIFDPLRITPAQEDFDAFTREVLNLNSQRPKMEKYEVELGSIPMGRQSPVQQVRA